MSATGLVMIADAIGAISFAVFTWGSILLVIVAFGYIIRALFNGSQNTE